nr:MAG TPA: multiple antibiotic resistance protein MarR/DNA family protein, HTH motif.67A [Caudoviricetes sp.]
MEYYNTQVIGAINIRPYWKTHDLTGADIATLTALCTWWNCEHIYPSKEAIQSRSQLSRASVTRALAHLTELGIIETRRTPGGTNEYAIHLDALLNHDGLVAAGATSHDRITGNPRTRKPLTPVADRVTEDDIARARARHDKAAAEKQAQKAQEAQERTEFNKAYPGTKATIRDWQKARQHATAREITDGARAYADQCRRRGTPARYIRTARRWLEDHDWENYQPAQPADTDDLLGNPRIDNPELINAETTPELMADIAAMWNNATNN